MTQNCYVRVINNIKNEFYDIGPFEYSGNESFSESESAIAWIYKQIGLIKIQNPDSTLIKHRWNYIIEPLLGAKADIQVEMGSFTFETFHLIDYKFHNVLNEEITQHND